GRARLPVGAGRPLGLTRAGPLRLVPPALGTDHGDVVEVSGARGTSMTPGGLTDDVLTQEPRARSSRAYLRDAVDRLAGADPGLAGGAYRIPSRVYVVALMTAAVYVRRWGPVGFRSGMVAFNGGFLGFFLHAQIGLGDIGWLAADMYIGVLASLLVRFTVLRS